MAFLLHFNQEPGKGPNLGWIKFHMALFHALCLDSPMVHCTIGLEPRLVDFVQFSSLLSEYRRRTVQVHGTKHNKSY